MIFPSPLIVREDDMGYDVDGWIAVLNQICDLDLEISMI
jgi:hypothetical protein